MRVCLRPFFCAFSHHKLLASPGPVAFLAFLAFLPWQPQEKRRFKKESLEVAVCVMFFFFFPGQGSQFEESLCGLGVQGLGFRG